VIRCHSFTVSHCDTARTARVIRGLDSSDIIVILTVGIFGIIFFHNLEGLLYNSQIQRAWMDCSKESKDIGTQSAVQSL
jgi:hypothetical protein